MGSCRLALGMVIVGLSSLAAAEGLSPSAPVTTGDAPLVLDTAWPSLPTDRSLSLEDRITDHLTDWGNHVGNRMDEWSHHYASLHVDGRGRRAQLHLGGGNEHLRLDFDSNWLFADGKAYAKVHLELAIQGHRYFVELPDMDVSHDSVRGQDAVQVNVSVLEKRF